MRKIKHEIIDRDIYPKNLAEAKRLIDKVFAEQSKYGWDEREQERYFKMIGVSGKTDESDVRKIISDMQNAKMIIFE